MAPLCRESVVMKNHPNMIHGRRHLRVQTSCVEGHHLHSLSIPRHPLYLNEYELILSSCHLYRTVSPVPTEIATYLSVVEPTPDLNVSVGAQLVQGLPRCSAPCRRSSRPTGTCATRSRTTAFSCPWGSSASSRSAGSRSPKSVSTLAPSGLPCSRSTTISRASGGTRSSCRRANACRARADASESWPHHLLGRLSGQQVFRYDPIGCSDDEDEDAPPSPPRVPGSAVTANADADAPPRSGLKARAVTEAEPEPAEPGNQLVRTCTQYTRTPRIYLPYFINLLLLFVCCFRLQHRTPDAVFLGAFCSVITIPPPNGNGLFCGSGKGVKLDAFSRH